MYVTGFAICIIQDTNPHTGRNYDDSIKILLLMTCIRHKKATG